MHKAKVWQRKLGVALMFHSMLSAVFRMKHWSMRKWRVLRNRAGMPLKLGSEFSERSCVWYGGIHCIATKDIHAEYGMSLASSWLLVYNQDFSWSGYWWLFFRVTGCKRCKIGPAADRNENDGIAVNWIYTVMGLESCSSTTGTWARWRYVQIS